MSSTPPPVDFIESSLAFSDEERDRGVPTPEHLAEALRLFAEHGFIRLENVFSAESMSRWDAHYRRKYARELRGTTKEDRRPLFSVDLEGPFNSPEFYANPLVLPFLQHYLGKECIVGALSSVASFPGAPDQYIHRDAQPIFGDDYEIDRQIPPYSVTMLIPFVDCTHETGCTKVWPGTHLENVPDDPNVGTPLEPVVRVGSVLLTNSKLLHRGGANLSQTLRPLVYLTYHRKWFRDFWGYETRPPISVSDAQLRRMPAEYQHMFAWIKDPYAKLRRKAALKRYWPVRILAALVGRGA